MPFWKEAPTSIHPKVAAGSRRGFAAVAFRNQIGGASVPARQAFRLQSSMFDVSQPIPPNHPPSLHHSILFPYPSCLVPPQVWCLHLRPAPQTTPTTKNKEQGTRNKEPRAKNLLHHSITPLLHYSTTPLLHYSTTPLLHYSTTPSSIFNHPPSSRRAPCALPTTHPPQVLCLVSDRLMSCLIPPPQTSRSCTPCPTVGGPGPQWLHPARS